MTSSPVLEPRTAADLMQDLLARLPGYTPEWTPAEGEASHAVAQVFAATSRRWPSGSTGRRTRTGWRSSTSSG